jgi:hypothetical protein
MSATEDILGKFLIRNTQLAAQGKPTHFAGDALYTAGALHAGLDALVRESSRSSAPCSIKRR